MDLECKGVLTKKAFQSYHGPSKVAELDAFYNLVMGNNHNSDHAFKKLAGEKTVIDFLTFQDALRSLGMQCGEARAIYTWLLGFEDPANRRRVTLDAASFKRINRIGPFVSLHQCEEIRTAILEKFGGADAAFKKMEGFKAIDRDNSGSISKDELDKAIKEAEIERAGKVTYFTIPAMQLFFGLIDADSSGTVTKKEWAAVGTWNLSTVMDDLRALYDRIQQRFAGTSGLSAAESLTAAYEECLVTKKKTPPPFDLHLFESALNRWNVKTSSSTRALFRTLDFKNDQRISPEEWQYLGIFEAEEFVDDFQTSLKSLQQKFGTQEALWNAMCHQKTQGFRSK
jgi:hypothetical protein